MQAAATRKGLEYAQALLNRIELDPMPQLDVIYINSIAWVGDNFERMGEELRLTKDSPLKPNAIILHPLARGAVFLRMALLTSIAGRIHQVIDAPTRDARGR